MILEQVIRILLGIDPPPASLPGAVTAPTINPTHASSNTNMGPRNVGFNTIDHTSNGFSFEGAGYGSIY